MDRVLTQALPVEYLPLVAVIAIFLALSLIDKIRGISPPSPPPQSSKTSNNNGWSTTLKLLCDQIQANTRVLEKLDDRLAQLTEQHNLLRQWLEIQMDNIRQNITDQRKN